MVGGGGQAKLGSGALEGRLLACCAHSTVAVRVEARLAAGDMGGFRSLDYLVGACEVVQRGGVSWGSCRVLCAAWAWPE